jgi:hypothetical protein
MEATLTVAGVGEEDADVEMVGRIDAGAVVLPGVGVAEQAL